MKLIGNSVSIPVIEQLVRAICDTGVFDDTDTPREIPLSSMANTTAGKPNLSSPLQPAVQQLTLFDPEGTEGLYVIIKSPITLLGTYRKICRDWIVEKNLYNYPVIDDEMNRHHELLAARRLILKHQKDEPLYFAITGYTTATKTMLKELGYKINAKHPAKTKYILYTLEKLDEPIPEFKQDEAYLVGNGLKPVIK